jgi:sugar phosphate isomerase/epimerase
LSFGYLQLQLIEDRTPLLSSTRNLRPTSDFPQRHPEIRLLQAHQRDRTPGKGIPDEVGVTNCIDSFKRLLPLAKELDIKMTIENHGGVSRTSEYILQIIRGTDPQWVGSCLDFMNWPHSPDQIHVLYESCQALAPHAYHTHAKCLTFKPDGEETTVDYARLLGYLKAAKYKGAISMEFEGPGDPVEGVKKSRDLIIKHWK